MRWLIMVIGLLLSIVAKSQGFAGMEKFLDMPSDSIISIEDMYSDPDGVIYSTLISCQPQKGGGFSMVYRTIIGGDSRKTSYKSFYISPSNKCYAVAIFNHIYDSDSQIKEIVSSGDFYTLNQTTLYARNENLKIIHYYLPKTNQVVYIYSRKGTIVPRP